MKLLADEDFPPTLISYLQRERHNVKRIQRSMQGISDLMIKEIALKERRIILSFDQDYLESAVDKQVSAMVLDFPYFKPDEIIPYMDEIIKVIVNLKRKKKPFIAKYSEKGLEIIKP